MELYKQPKNVNSFFKFSLGLCNITGGGGGEKTCIPRAPNEPAQCSDDLGSIAQQKVICAGAYLQKWGHNHPLSVDPVIFCPNSSFWQHMLNLAPSTEFFSDTLQFKFF